MGCVYSDYLTFVKISIVDISDYLYIRKSAVFVIYATYLSLLFSLYKIDAQCCVRLRDGTCKWSQESAEKVLTSRNNVCNVNSQFPPPNIADKFNPLLYLLRIHFAEIFVNFLPGAKPYQNQGAKQSKNHSQNKPGIKPRKTRLKNQAQNARKTRSTNARAQNQTQHQTQTKQIKKPVAKTPEAKPGNIP